jgi:hypothetical protein
MSNDLRALRSEYKAILQNKNVIAINQDKLGIMGKRKYKVMNFIFNLLIIYNITEI